MRYSSQGRFHQQFRFLRGQFLQDGDLPFSNVLSEDMVAQALTAVLVARETERLWSGVRELVEVGGSSKGCGFGFSEAWPEGLKGFEEC